MPTGLGAVFPDNREKYREKSEKNCPTPSAVEKCSIIRRFIRFCDFGYQGRKFAITGKRQKITAKEQGAAGLPALAAWTPHATVQKGEFIMRSSRVAVAIAIVFACLIALGAVSDFLVDWTWYSSVGFLDVFWAIINAKVILFAAGFLATVTVIWVNGVLASRAARARAYLLPANSPWESLSSKNLPAVIERFVRRLPWRSLVAIFSIGVATLVALGWTTSWNMALNFIHQVPYGRSDPLYGNDFSFYLFSLPAFVALKDWMLLVLALSDAPRRFSFHGDRKNG